MKRLTKTQIRKIKAAIETLRERATDVDVEALAFNKAGDKEEYEKLWEEATTLRKAALILRERFQVFGG